MSKRKGSKACQTPIALPVIIFREGKWWVAHCPVIDVASQGKTVEEAKKNIEDAIDLYMGDKDTTKPILKELEVSITTVNVNAVPAEQMGGQHHAVACPVGA